MTIDSVANACHWVRLGSLNCQFFSLSLRACCRSMAITLLSLFSLFILSLLSLLRFRWCFGRQFPLRPIVWSHGPSSIKARIVIQPPLLFQVLLRILTLIFIIQRLCPRKSGFCTPILPSEWFLFFLWLSVCQKWSSWAWMSRLWTSWSTMEEPSGRRWLRDWSVVVVLELVACTIVHVILLLAYMLNSTVKRDTVSQEPFLSLLTIT